MDVQLTTAQFIEQLQSYANRSNLFPREVEQLINATNQRGLEQIFLDAIFHAKFATKTREVMNRIGRDGEGFDKLSAEFQKSIEKVTTLLKTIVKESPEDVKKHFVNDFFAMDQKSFSNLLKLLEDLSWVKNWEVDGKPLPLANIQTAGLSQGRRSGPPESSGPALSIEDLTKVARGSALGFVLMILLMLIDPPVGLIGWGIVVVVSALLLFVAVTALAARKKSRTQSATTLQRKPQ